MPTADTSAESPPTLDQRLAGLPPELAARLREARSALEGRRADDAARVLEQVQAAAGAHPEFLRLLGITRQFQRRPADAVALYQMALLTFTKGDFLRARAFIQRFESTSSADAQALDLAARIEERLGDRDAAAKYRERLKTEFPDFEPGQDTGGSKSP